MTSQLNSTRDQALHERPVAEMAAWDPAEEHEDVAWELAELDRHGMLLLGQVGVVTLVLALATGLLARLS